MEKNKQEQGQRWKDNPEHMKTRQSEIEQLKYDNPDINIQDIAKIYDSISELRKPSEDFTFGSDISEIVLEFENASLYANSHKSSREELRRSLYAIRKKWGLFYGKKLRKPSESIGQTDEELVRKIEGIIMQQVGFDDLEPENLIIFKSQSKNAAIEIVKLLPHRSQENAVNVELLEAAQYFQEAWMCEWSKLTALSEDVSRNSLAILNAEKQLKQ